MTDPRPRTALELVYRIQELADYIVPFAIRMTCELRVADLLTDGPRPVAQLAAATGTHPPTLCRVLRTLATKEIFVEVEPEVFGLTPAAQLFRGDHPLSLRDAYPMIPANFEAWAHFAHTVRTGEPVFPHVHGVPYYEHLATHPDDSARFDGIQGAGSRLELRATLRAYEWGRLASVVDVGGSNGAFLAGLLARYRRLRGVLFELPHVAKGAEAVLAAAGVADRCEVVAGDFFAGVPAGHDAYVLKRVLYDWDDADAGRLLRSVREAVRPDSRLLVLDPVVDPRPELAISKTYDLLSLTMLGGRARTEDEVVALCGEAGFAVTRVVQTAMFPLIEAAPR
ncbi:methyltransferase [Micromonospora sp. CPCC 206061]|uniref:methyltransferase n=1 Tax=Micromonospora sp. CPCC 206061 TaxID=3122410 RepID=UPI002FF3A64B